MSKTKLDQILGIPIQELKDRVKKEKQAEKRSVFKFDFTPRELYDELTKFVVGQDDALQKVCNAVCYHYQSLSSGKETKKNNVLLIGPTGCGKTYVVEKISKVLEVPLLISDATKYSAAGYVGDKVENLVQHIVSQAEGDFNSASRGIIYLDEIDKIAARELAGRDVSGRDVQSGLLKIMEGADIEVDTGHGKRMLNTKDMLFVFGGAFSDLYDSLKEMPKMGFIDSRKEKDLDNGEALYGAEPHKLIKGLIKYGMIPEFIGRIPVIARFRQLTQEDFVKILKESEDSPIGFYKKELESYNIKASFAEEAYGTIARLASERGMGARGLKSVIEESLTPYKFYLPGMKIKEIMISSEAILNPNKTLLALFEEQQNKISGGKK